MENTDKKLRVENMHYFDNAATTPVCAEARDAVLEAISESFANPSSVHSLGVRAESMVKIARERVAHALGCKTGEIYFTSGGTEAANWAILSAARKNARLGRHIITTRAEHSSVAAAIDELCKEGFEVTCLPLAADCYPADFAAAVREDTILASVMLVNNETGGVFPVAEMAALLKMKAPNAIFHTDAVQGFLKIPFTPARLGADLISVSAHKVHGIKGAGALYIREGLGFLPLLRGGGQENGLRAGTEAVPAIAAFGAAVKAGFAEFDENISKMTGLRQYILDNIAEKLPGIVIARVRNPAPHIISLSLPGCPSEVTIRMLEEGGIYAGSSGSACGKGKRSRTLTAMGVDSRVIDCTVRVSLSPQNTIEDADALIKGFGSVISRMGKKRR